MHKIRKQAAGVFVLAALATTLAPATASAGPDLECIKKAVAAEINHIVNGGPVPLPCG